MGVLVKTLSLFGEEYLWTYLTASLYFIPALALLSLAFRREANVHELSSLPLGGVMIPGYVGLLDARRRFVTNSKEMVKEAYYKARRRFLFILETET